MPDFLIELDIARNEGSYKKLMKQYRKYHLLILDEWMLVSLKENEARDVLEIIHARHHNGSTIFCSQFTPAGWHYKIGEDTIADAILDRIVHDSYLIEIHSSPDENSMRERYGIKRSKPDRWLRTPERWLRTPERWLISSGRVAYHSPELWLRPTGIIVQPTYSI